METAGPSLDRLAAELATLGERLSGIGSELRTIQLDRIQLDRIQLDRIQLDRIQLDRIQQPEPAPQSASPAPRPASPRRPACSSGRARAAGCWPGPAAR